MEGGNNVWSFEYGDDEVVMIQDMMLFIVKLIFYVCNVVEEVVYDGNDYIKVFKEVVVNESVEVILISVGIEVDIIELDDIEERMEFLQDMGLSELGVNCLICFCYKFLKLIIYFIVGEKEV